MSDKGFSLVELAIVLVIIGVLLAGGLRVRTVVDSARGKRVVASVTVLADAQNRYYERMKRLAGDQGNDGVIDFTNLASAAPSNNSNATAASADYAFNELKSLNILPSNSNTLLSATQSGAFMYYAGTAAGVNLIVIRNAECAAAFEMEQQMDNNSPANAGSASSGRVRRIDSGSIASNSTWTTAGTDCVVNGAVSSTARTNIVYIIGSF